MKRLASSKSSIPAAIAGPLLLAAALAAGALLPAAAQAQPTRPKTRGTIQDAEIEIVKDRVNTLPEATRNFEKIRLAPPPKPDRKVTYTYPDFRLPVTRLNPAIQVLTIAQEQPETLTGNYLKLGAGNYGTLYGRAHLHSTRNELYSYGLDLRHQSSASGPVDDKNSAVSQTSVAATGEYYQDATTFGAALDYSRDRYHYYGYNAERLPAKPDADAIRQTYNRFGLRAYARNRATATPLQYEVGLGYKYWGNEYTASEHNVLLNGKAGYDLDETSRVTVQADASFISEKESLPLLPAPDSRSRTFVQATPAYELTTKTGLSLTLGATLGYSAEPSVYYGDKFYGASKGRVFPAVRVGYAITPEKFQVYGGLGGAIQRVTMYDLTQENPWLGQGQAQTIADTHYGPSAYVGFTAAPAGGLEVAARATFSRADNLYFYNISTFYRPDTTQFDLVYDQQTINVFTLHAEALYSAAEKVRVGLKADYNHYGVKSLAQPFGRPALQGLLYGTYQASDKLQLGADFTYYSPNYGNGPYKFGAGGEVVHQLRQTDSVIDLSLRGDYRINPKFSIFALANNVANRKYQPYLNYPVKGFNGILGLTYSF